MEKKLQSIAVLIISMFLVITSSMMFATQEVFANPYPGGYSNCTWTAWQICYETTGVSLPGWSDAGTWLNSAKKAGYSTGMTAKANSIAVWTGNGGHVAFVSAVSGNQMYIKEGGYDGGYNEQWIGTNASRSYGTQSLAGFIYVKNTPTPTPTFSILSTAKQTPKADDAYVYVKFSTSNGQSVKWTAANLAVYDSAGNKVAYYSETCSWNTSYLEVSYNIKTDTGVKLKSGTNYTWQIGCSYVINGVTKSVKAAKQAFKTTGGHTCSYTWKTTKTATCTTDGQKRGTCSCGNYIIERIPALGHSYGSYEITKKATCTTMGSKKKTCTRCGNVVTETIPVLGHVFDENSVKESKATLYADGEKSEKCTVCGYKTTDKIIPKIDENSICLEKNKYEYDDSEKRPSVTICDREGKMLVLNKDYKLEYSNNINVGTAKINITFIGNYAGTITKTFTIDNNKKDSKQDKDDTESEYISQHLSTPRIKEVYLFSYKKSITIRWYSELITNEEVDGIQIRYSTKKNMNMNKKATVDVLKESKKIKNLKSKEKYYLQMRTYVYNDGGSIYSPWSAKKSIKTL